MYTRRISFAHHYTGDLSRNGDDSFHHMREIIENWRFRVSRRYTAYDVWGRKQPTYLHTRGACSEASTEMLQRPIYRPPVAPARSIDFELMIELFCTVGAEMGVGEYW